MAVTFINQSNIYLPADDTINWQNKLTFTTRVSAVYPNRTQLAGNWYLNWGLWIDNGGSYGESATMWKLPALFAEITVAQLTPVFPLVVPLVFMGGGANNNNNKITTGRITFTNPSANNIDILIEFWHFLHSDFINFQTPASWDNLQKFTRNSFASPTDLANTSPAAYNYAKIARLRLYVQQTTVNNDVSVAIQNFNALPRWYNSEALGVVIPTLSNPTFVLSRTAGIVTNLSTVEDTKVTFSTTGNYTLAHLGLIRTDLINQTVTQIISQTASYAAIPALTPPAFQIPVTNTAIKAPTALIGLNSHFAHIDRLQLVAGAKYRIFAVVTSAGKRYSFMSGEFLADNSLPILPPTVTDFMADVESEKATRWLNTTANERVRSRMVWDGTPYNVNKTTPFATALQQITVRIYWVEVIGLDTFKHIVEQYVRPRNLITAFTAADKLTVTAVGQVLTMFYTWRNRSEPANPNLITLKNGVALPTPLANQNWNGKTLFIEWTLDLAQPPQAGLAAFTDTLVRSHSTTVINYVNTLTFDFFNGVNPQGNFICDDQVSTKVRVTGGGSSFVAWLIDNTPFTVFNIQEEDTFAAFAGVPALDSPKYANVPVADPSFVANVANATTANFQIPTNIAHKVGVIFKVPAVCGAAGQILTNSNFIAGNNWTLTWVDQVTAYPSLPAPPVAWPQNQAQLNSFFTGTSVAVQRLVLPVALAMFQAVSINPLCCYKVEMNLKFLCAVGGAGHDPHIQFLDAFGNNILDLIVLIVYPVCPANIATLYYTATVSGAVLAASKFLKVWIDENNYPTMVIDYVFLTEITC